MKHLFKPCDDFCTSILTSISIVLFSVSFIYLTYSIINDTKSEKNLKGDVNESNRIEYIKPNEASMMALNIDSQKISFSKKIYLSDNKAIIVKKEK